MAEIEYRRIAEYLVASHTENVAYWSAPCALESRRLIAERDKYGANDVRPGITGWAQINGRDELEIPEKAKLDGEYVKRMSFLFDCKCFFGTIKAVFKHEGIVEGGTGQLHMEEAEKQAESEAEESVLEISDDMDEKSDISSTDESVEDSVENAESDDTSAETKPEEETD